MRNTLFLTAALLLVGGSAFAQSSSNSSAVNAANSAAIINNNIPGTTFNRSTGRVISTVPAYAPGLTSAGLNSCAGSASGGAGATGISIVFGSTYELEECTRRANAAALAGLGQNAAALEMLCESESMRRALNASGTLCPSQRADYIRAQAEANRLGRPVEGYAEPLPPAEVTRGRARAGRKYARRAAIEAQLSNSR